MKRLKINRIFGIAVILSLLILAIPATPVFAATLAATPASGQVGTSVTITGSGFNPSIPGGTPYQVLVYFSKQTANPGQYIGTDITIYMTATIKTTTELGNFSGTFTIPSTIMTTAVTQGNYYLYACQSTNPSQILISTPFTVVGSSELSIDVDEGPVDSLVEITGSDFTASQPIFVEFAGDEVDIEDGNTTTGTTGSFVSYIAIPEIRAGTHNIDVSVGTGTSAIVETVQFTVTPDIVISPQSGEAGTSVSISGTGFSRRKPIDIYYNSTNLVQSAMTDPNGSFYTNFAIPEVAGLAAGAYAVEAEDTDLNMATTMFTLNIPTQPEPTETEPTETEPTETQPTQTEPSPSTVPMNLSASGNIVGSLIGISGAGFTPGAEVIIKYDEYIIAMTTSDAAGLIVATFYAPPSVAGDHIITATDGTVIGTTIFTMESIAPAIPEPENPKAGDKVKSPISFDWSDVVDNSATAVTYMIQIATNESFSASSIVLEKTGIEISEYTLTDMEEEDLAGQEEPYYWRIQAVDAASNESGWTSAMEVYISPPFSFPKWLLYTLLAVGAVVIFVVGYWLGRRTAFMY